LRTFCWCNSFPAVKLPALDVLHEKSLNVNIPYPLISDIAQGRCLPFIGAGFSKNAILPRGYSMPDWNELTSILAVDAGTPPGTAPPAVAERYEHKFGRVQLIEAIRESLHPGKARPGSAHRAFARLPFDTIYTTNFDLLLEDAYTEEIRPFRSLVGELQLPFHAGQTASNIIKMHGDVRHEEHVIVTQRDYDQFMDRYPVIATHLSAMLITRTPLFIGYSLSDPDFENIRRVVKSRLGEFERMAYVVQFDIPPDEVEDELAKKIHIVSLDSKVASSYDEVLAAFLTSIQEQLDTKAGVNLRNARPDLFEEIETEVVKKAVESPQQLSVIETTSHLCFVMMPFSNRFDEVYRNLIAPVVRDNGLSVLRADEMAGPGFVLEQIRSAIQQSRLCIADLTGNNPNVLYEVGYAQAFDKPLILIAEEASRLPFDVAHQRVITYGAQLEESQVKLNSAISQVLSENRMEEAARLFDMKQYRGAIAASAIVLEQKLRSLLAKRSPERLARMTMNQMLDELKKRRALKATHIAQLQRVVNLRNHAVHEMEELSRQDAQFVLSAIRKFLEETTK
jgi:nucleoside 2-deoxyribosyltransferase